MTDNSNNDDLSSVEALINDAFEDSEDKLSNEAAMKFMDALPEMKQKLLEAAQHFVEEHAQDATEARIFVITGKICPVSGPQEGVITQFSSTDGSDATGQCGTFHAVALSRYEVMQMLRKLDTVAGGNMQTVGEPEDGGPFVISDGNSRVEVHQAVPASAFLLTPLLPFTQMEE